MRLGLLALAAFALLVVLRRRRAVSARVVVAWRDGTVLDASMSVICVHR